MSANPSQAVNSLPTCEQNAENEAKCGFPNEMHREQQREQEHKSADSTANNRDEKSFSKSHSERSISAPIRPRIGIAPPRPIHVAAHRLTADETAATRQSLDSLQAQQSLLDAAGELDDLVAEAVVLAQATQPLQGCKFKSATGHYVQRSGGLLLRRGQAWRWCILEIALGKYLLIVSDPQERPLAAVSMRLSWEPAIAAA